MDHISSEDKKRDSAYLAFFDLDRTIIGKISGAALVRMAWKKKMISPADFFNAFYLYLLYRSRIMDPMMVIDEMVVWVRGKPAAWMESLCAEACRVYLLPSVFIEAAKTIRFHKQNNARVIILSSALSPICARVAEYLNMDGYICSSLEAKEGFLTGKPAGKICIGDEKLVRLTEYCQDNKFPVEHTWYYADSISDLPALAGVGHPVCVNPDKKLKKEAEKRGWEILFYL